VGIKGMNLCPNQSMKNYSRNRKKLKIKIYSQLKNPNIELKLRSNFGKLVDYFEQNAGNIS